MLVDEGAIKWGENRRGSMRWELAQDRVGIQHYAVDADLLLGGRVLGGRVLRSRAGLRYNACPFPLNRREKLGADAESGNVRMIEDRVTHIVVSGTARWHRRSVAGHLIASCTALKILVWGESEEDLEAKQRQAVGLVVLHLYRHGTLESFLESRGFSVDVTEGIVARQIASGAPAPTTLGPHFHFPLKHVYA